MGPTMLQSRHLCRLSLLAVLVGVTASAWAGPQSGNEPARRRGQQSQQQDPQQQPPGQRHHQSREDQRALSDAVRRAERATGGQVLSAERVQYDGRDVNRIKLVDDRGRVRVYWDNPQGGQQGGQQDGQQNDQQDGDEDEEQPRGRRTRDDDGGSD